MLEYNHIELDKNEDKIGIEMQNVPRIGVLI